MSITQPSIKLYYNNQGTMKLSHNLIFHTRWIKTYSNSLPFHKRVIGGEIKLQYINTNAQLADALIKPLCKVKFNQHRTSLGLHNLASLREN